MNLSAISKPPGIFTHLFHYLAGLPRSLRQRIESWVPVGYEDESGFHLGVEDKPFGH